MVFYKEAYVIVHTLVEVLLCTGKRIEVFYFHVFSVGRNKVGLFFLPRYSPNLANHKGGGCSLLNVQFYRLDIGHALVVIHNDSEHVVVWDKTA